MTLVRNIVQFLHPHYVMNIILATMYYPLKSVSPFCYLLFEDCQLELREWELLTFLGCVLVLKNRKQPSYKMYFSTMCMFAKMLSVFLFFRQNPLIAVIYIILCLLHLAFFPEPAYSGPNHVTYFRGDVLEAEIKYDTRVTWLICFYAAWSPTCVNFAPIFAELSGQYHLDNFKFGKLDLTRFPKTAEKYKINMSSWSKQLPTLILFQNGKEYCREPNIDIRGKILNKFIFSADNVVRSFNINEIHNTCKKNPIKKKKVKKDLETPLDDVNGKTKTE